MGDSEAAGGGGDGNSSRSKQEEGSTKAPENVEEVIAKLGGFGRFQVLALVLILAMEIPTALLVFIPVFIGKTPNDWLCDDELVSRFEACDCNGTLEALDPHTSVVAEWGLICDSSWVSDTVVSVQLFAMVVGNIIASQISDWYGRRRGFHGMAVLMILGTAVTASAPNPYVYMGARFICGASFSGFLSINAIYPMEFMTPKWRPLSSALGPFGIGIMLLPLMAYYIRAWRTLVWASAAPFAIIVIIYPFLPESPRWLLRNQKVEECFKVTSYIARVNGTAPIEKQTLQDIADRERKAQEEAAEMAAVRRFTYTDFFRDPDLRKTTLYLQGLWFSWGIVYFGISYNIKNLPGDPFLNVVYMGLADSVGYPTSFVISDKLGRRRGLFVSMTFAAVFLVTIAILQFVPAFTYYPTVLAILCCLGRFGIAAARSMARTLTGESFPTAVRTMGLALAGSPAGIAGALSAQLVYLGSFWPSAPFFAFGVISVIGSVMGFLLSETAGKALQEEVRVSTKKKIVETKIINSQTVAPIEFVKQPGDSEE